MILILGKTTPKQVLDKFLDALKQQKIRYYLSLDNSAIKILGESSEVQNPLSKLLSYGGEVKTDSEGGEDKFFLSSRRYHSEDTVINVGGKKYGGNNFRVIAGPCSVESQSQILEIAHAVKKIGASALRGGAFKPRTSPYSFQGLEEEGLKYLLTAKNETGLPICTEITSPQKIDLFKDVDILQIGARNMQNYELLKEVGKTNKPVLLKRGLSATIDEWLLSAEYIMSEGSKEVILCERGIRTFESDTRNTLDLSVIPLLKEKTHLPVIVDPSHALGISRLIPPMSLASVGAGADGLIIEVHSRPKAAVSDGAQSLDFRQFDDLMSKVGTMLPLVGKTM